MVWRLALVADFGTQNIRLKTKFDMETKLDNTTEQQHDAKLPVMCSSFWEIFEMLNRGKVIFERGYLQTLGEMQRQGLITVDLYKDGTAVVSKNCT